MQNTTTHTGVGNPSSAKEQRLDNAEARPKLGGASAHKSGGRHLSFIQKAVQFLSRLFIRTKPRLTMQVMLTPAGEMIVMHGNQVERKSIPSEDSIIPTIACPGVASAAPGRRMAEQQFMELDITQATRH